MDEKLNKDKKTQNNINSTAETNETEIKDTISSSEDEESMGQELLSTFRPELEPKTVCGVTASIIYSLRDKINIRTSENNIYIDADRTTLAILTTCSMYLKLAYPDRTDTEIRAALTIGASFIRKEGPKLLNDYKDKILNEEIGALLIVSGSANSMHKILSNPATTTEIDDKSKTESAPTVETNNKVILH